MARHPQEYHAARTGQLVIHSPEGGEVKAPVLRGVVPRQQEVGAAPGLPGIAQGDGDKPLECLRRDVIHPH